MSSLNDQLENLNLNASHDCPTPIDDITITEKPVEIVQKQQKNPRIRKNRQQNPATSNVKNQPSVLNLTSSSISNAQVCSCQDKRVLSHNCREESAIKERAAKAKSINDKENNLPPSKTKKNIPCPFIKRCGSCKNEFTVIFPMRLLIFLTLNSAS